MTTTHWQFWIDVGGTFTDAFALSPGGELRRRKVLSSGIVKGAVGDGSSRERLVDPGRLGDAAGLWTGYEVHLLGKGGETVAVSRVAAFDGASGTLLLDPPLGAAPEPGRAYELRSGEEAPIVAIRLLLGLPLNAPLPPCAVRLGTTRGTNALLTRSGARTAMVLTKGFGDVLEIGDQARPRLFDLAIRKPEPLHEAVVEVAERVAADGSVLREFDRGRLRRDLAELRARGIESLAVVLMNSYVAPEHEEIVLELAREAGFVDVRLSSRVAPFVKIVPRGETTRVDAYLDPVLREYVERLRASLGESAGDLRVLTSAGGLVDAARFTGKDSILSGPAGGVVGFSRVAQAAGFASAIGFDMGGTSTDVARWAGRYELEHESTKAGVRLVAPMLAIETVAAGGGSICAFDGVKLTVGPASAGADPGPACYGRGGPLTVTDLNVFLGRVLPEHFPFPLDREAVARRLDALIEEIDGAVGKRYSPEELADGLRRVANANMVKAIRSITVAKGCDPRGDVLVAFGGAAAQHACAVARELGIRRVLSHPDAGILSAYGIGLADVIRHPARGVYRKLDDPALDALEAIFAELEAEGRREVEAEGVAAERITARHELDLRYRGLDAFLAIAAPPTDDRAAKTRTADGWAEAYAAEHRRLYGYEQEGREIEIVAARVEVTGRSRTTLPEARRVEPATTPAPFDAARGIPVHRREDLRPGDALRGPAIVVERLSTTVLDPGWTAEMLSDGQLLLTEEGSRAAPDETAMAEVDPILLEIFNNAFAGIAEQMGITLRKTSSSVNVKERLDFSCAIFTPSGDLVVNAPHMPVHLGAMAETVKRVLADNPELGPGDVVLTNDPYRGGSHLPDLTVVTPVHDDDGALLFLTAGRAHHAEIGGITPGSMPPFSKNLAEEGVLIRNFRLVDGGRPRFEALRDLLVDAPHPSRNPDDNLADTAAQVAANRQGARDLLALVERWGVDVVTAYMGHIQDAAERKMRAALARLPDGRHAFLDHLDDDSPIAVAITIDGDRATVDFTGTGPVLAGNLNANRAIVTAAVMYVMRCLLTRHGSADEDIPLNHGVLAPIELILPECLLNPPERERAEDCAAVVGGNVETSQRVTDVLLGALGLAAASQGTMNNTLFGDHRFGYYETLGGGSGATAEAAGASAVHTHMTNTRLTDPEVLEQRFPVRLRRFETRRGSGGAGRHRGGDGIVREIEFLRPLTLSVLSERRGDHPPYGLHGGAPGATGRNLLERRDGTVLSLGGKAQVDVAAGDVLRIETPGGGGWGDPDPV